MVTKGLKKPIMQIDYRFLSCNTSQLQKKNSNTKHNGKHISGEDDFQNNLSNNKLVSNLDGIKITSKLTKKLFSKFHHKNPSKPLEKAVGCPKNKRKYPKKIS